MSAVVVREGFLEGVLSELPFVEFSRLRARQPAHCWVYSRACSAGPIVCRCPWGVALLEGAPLLA